VWCRLGLRVGRGITFLLLCLEAATSATLNEGWEMEVGAEGSLGMWGCGM